MDKGHGRLEIRSIQVSTALHDYLSFPPVGQVFRLTRERIHRSRGTHETEIIYGLSSLPPQAAPPARLLALTRGHWAIETRSHYGRDMAYDEDRQQIRRCNGPRVMATLRNVAISLLRLAGYQNITAALRDMSAPRRAAFGLLGLRR